MIFLTLTDLLSTLHCCPLILLPLHHLLQYLPLGCRYFQSRDLQRRLRRQRLQRFLQSNVSGVVIMHTTEQRIYHFPIQP